MCIEIYGKSCMHDQIQSFAGPLGTFSNGKVSYCCDLIMIPSRPDSCIAIIAGEDGNLRSFSIKDKFAITFQQEIEFPFHRPVRALATQQSGDCSSRKGIVAAGGGNLQFAIYRFDLSVLTENGNGILQSHLPMNTLLTLAVGGSTWDKAEQEHRILSISLSWLPTDIYLICLCDARGKITVMSFEYDTRHCHRLIAFDGSEHPIISSCILTFFIRQTCTEGPPDIKRTCSDKMNSTAAILIVGDNSGLIHFFQLPLSSNDDSVRLGQCEAHSMGTDAIHAVNCKPFSQNSVGGLVVCSGGDDQAIHITVADVKAASTV